MSGLNLGYFVSIVKRDHPDWPAFAVRWQAKRMLDRHPAVLAAYNAGIAQGRELRQRMEHGLGVWWPEMEPLSPEERGFVLALVRKEIEPKAALLALMDLAEAEGRMATEAYEQQADDLANDWQQKSDAPDRAVRAVKALVT